MADYTVKRGDTAATSVKYKKNESTDAVELNQLQIDGMIKYAKAYTVSFTAPDYGSWGSASKTAYYGDTLSNSGQDIICYKFGTSTER